MKIDKYTVLKNMAGNNFNGIKLVIAYPGAELRNRYGLMEILNGKWRSVMGVKSIPTIKYCEALLKHNLWYEKINKLFPGNSIGITAYNYQPKMWTTDEAINKFS